MRYLNDFLDLGIKEIPSYTSIKNWVEKSGYHHYTHSELKSSTAPYCEIVDESMQIGSEKLLLTLGTKADKDTSVPSRITSCKRGYKIFTGRSKKTACPKFQFSGRNEARRFAQTAVPRPEFHCVFLK